MGNVYSITLCDRDLHHVPDDIYKHHKHVSKLLLRRNNIQEIPPDIKVLTNLVELSLRDNLLTTVPMEIASLRLLQKLSLANNRLQEPPTPIDAFTQLTWLSLASNTLTWLPDSFSRLQKLTSLDLQRNRFSTIPECVFELRSLTILLLQKNRITSISPRIGQCTELVSLNLSYNRIQQLPVEMGACRNLQHLLLSVNAIQSLPSILCESWTSILNLDLHTNDLKDLPDTLGAMKTLRRLNLAINKIEVIPPAIGQLRMLEWLNLNDNKLETLPSTMDQMQKLVKMGIVQNKLQTLPAALAKLSVLYKLDCRRNEIEYLPSAFKDMQGIHSLLLEENPLCFRYGISNYNREPVSLLELAARAVLDRFSPQESMAPTSCGSPSALAGLDSSDSSQDEGSNGGVGISHLLPMMADLGLTKGSTLPPPPQPPAPQKSRYSFFTRACASVHPQSSKPSRSSTINSTSSSDSSNSSSSSSPTTASLSSSLTCSTLATARVADSPKSTRQKLSPRSLKPHSLFQRPTILQRHSSESSQQKQNRQQQQQQQQQQQEIAAHLFRSQSQRSMEKTRTKARVHLSELDRLLDPETSPLPLTLIDLLSIPTTPCDYCERRMCTSGWVDFLEPAKLGNSRVIVPVRHRMCSLQCVQQQHRDSFGGELTDAFETTDFHVGPNGEIVGSRPIVPGELDEYMIEAVQEAADAAGISITHLLEQHQQHQQAAAPAVEHHADDAPDQGVPATVPGSISITALNQMNQGQINAAPSSTGPSAMLRQTTARLRRSLSRPLTPIEIQVDAQGQLRRVVYRQVRNTSHRRRLLETFRSLSQVGAGNSGGGLGGLGVLAATSLGGHPGVNGAGPGAGDAGAGGHRGGSAQRAGEVMNVTTFATELERF